MLIQKGCVADAGNCSEVAVESLDHQGGPDPHLQAVVERPAGHECTAAHSRHRGGHHAHLRLADQHVSPSRQSHQVRP
eukprot:5306498-Pyramimonas_sp.AAC.2